MWFSLAQYFIRVRTCALDILGEIASIARHAGNASRAKSLCLAALRTYKSVLGDSHPQVALVLNKLGGLCFELGTKEELEEAKRHVSDALDIIGEDALNDTDVSTAESVHILGKISMAEYRKLRPVDAWPI